MQPNGVSPVQDLLALGPIRGANIHEETHGVDCCKVIFGESENFAGEKGGTQSQLPLTVSHCWLARPTNLYKVAYLHSVNVGIGERVGEKDAQDMAPSGPLVKKMGQLPAKKWKRAKEMGPLWVAREKDGKRWGRCGHQCLLSAEGGARMLGRRVWLLSQRCWCWSRSDYFNVKSDYHHKGGGSAVDRDHDNPELIVKLCSNSLWSLVKTGWSGSQIESWTMTMKKHFYWWNGNCEGKRAQLCPVEQIMRKAIQETGQNISGKHSNMYNAAFKMHQHQRAWFCHDETDF